MFNLTIEPLLIAINLIIILQEETTTRIQEKEAILIPGGNNLSYEKLPKTKLV